MLKKIAFTSLIAAFAGLGLSAFAAPESPKTATERAVTEPLEIWGNLGGETAAAPSTEYLEKMALNFDKINNPLCAAAAVGNKKELQFLLRDGASPDSTDSLGISALSHAILGNNKDAFSILMSAGANSNQKGPFGVTPLMLAANSNLTEMVSLLLLNGADPNVRNDDGQTALSIARQKKLHDVINLLEPPKKIEPKPEPLLITAEQPSSPDKPADVSEKKVSSKSVPKPSPPRAPLASQDEALLRAIQGGLTETAAQLIQNGANPNVKTQDGISPLFISVSRNDIVSSEMLLQHKAKANIRSEFDMTPLMIAAQKENPPMIRMLLQYGSNPRLENIAGQSACDLGLASADSTVRALFSRCLE